jgi:hypothetical protein
VASRSEVGHSAPERAKARTNLMAAAQHSDRRAMDSVNPDETCVALRLEFGGCSRDELDDWAIVVQEVVDQHANDAAPGAAVRCLYSPLIVEILFTVENETKASVHQRVAAIVGSIEAVIPRRFDTDTATRSADHRNLVPA